MTTGILAEACPVGSRIKELARQAAPKRKTHHAHSIAKVVRLHILIVKGPLVDQTQPTLRKVVGLQAALEKLVRDSKGTRGGASPSRAQTFSRIDFFCSAHCEAELIGWPSSSFRKAPDGCRG